MTLAEEIPHTFLASQPALASEVNENFLFLLEQAQKFRAGGKLYHYVDCDQDSYALQTAIHAGHHRIRVTGSECLGGISATHTLLVESADSSPVNIKLTGDERIEFFGGPIFLFNVHITTEVQDTSFAFQTWGTSLFWIGGSLTANEGVDSAFKAYGNGSTYIDNVKISCNGAKYAFRQNGGDTRAKYLTITDGIGDGCQSGGIYMTNNAALSSSDLVANLDFATTVVRVYNGSVLEIKGLNNSIHGIDRALYITKSSQLRISDNTTIKGEFRVSHNSIARLTADEEGDGTSIKLELDTNNEKNIRITENSTLTIESIVLDGVEIRAESGSILKLDESTLTNQTLRIVGNSSLIAEQLILDDVEIRAEHGSLVELDESTIANARIQIDNNSTMLSTEATFENAYINADLGSTLKLKDLTLSNSTARVAMGSMARLDRITQVGNTETIEADPSSSMFIFD